MDRDAIEPAAATRGDRRPLRLLLPCEGLWEGDAVDELSRRGELVVHRERFDPLSLRALLRAPRFDAARHVERLAQRYRGRVDAVWSNDEPIGCLLAALVAQRLGLPAADPRAIVRAQHKALFRAVLAGTCPELSIDATVLERSVADPALADRAWLESELAAARRDFPLFCKPIKATFSVLARAVRDVDELVAHLRLSCLDRRLLASVVRPFEQLAATCGELPCRADRPIVEELLDGVQVDVDGYVFAGEIVVLGVVDEWMYPHDVAGARHFAGFTWPSRLPGEAQQRACDAAISVVRAVGYDHGLFNVELCVRRDGSVKVIEMNPRAAGQFATIYRDVAGLELERLAIDLAAGRDPAARARSSACAGAAASFVFRRFDGRPAPRPSRAALAWLAATHPRARLWSMQPGRIALRREYRWLGSHRHAVLNVSAPDFDALLALGDECGARLFGTGVLPGRERGGAGAPHASGSATVARTAR